MSLNGSWFHVSMFLFCWDVLCDQCWDSQVQSFVQNTKTNSPPMSTYSGLMAPPKPSMPEHYIKWSNSCYTLALSGISGTPGLPQVSPHHFCNVQPLCSWDPLQTLVTSRRFGRSRGRFCWSKLGFFNWSQSHWQQRPKKLTFWNMILIQIPQCTGRITCLFAEIPSRPGRPLNE